MCRWLQPLLFQIIGSHWANSLSRYQHFFCNVTVPRSKLVMIHLHEIKSLQNRRKLSNILGPTMNPFNQRALIRISRIGLPLSSLRKAHHRHWTHINVCRISCWGGSNMLLVLSFTFYFHYNTKGCMCSTGPFKYRRSTGYIYSSCYYHHQIGGIYLPHCFHMFPWLCAWDVCYIIICHLLYLHSGKTMTMTMLTMTMKINREFVFMSIVQFMMSANNRIRFRLQIVFVCLYITPYHYHHCANFIWRHWTYKMPVRYNLSSVWVRLSIFSQLSIIQYVGLCVFS